MTFANIKAVPVIGWMLLLALCVLVAFQIFPRSRAAIRKRFSRFFLRSLGIRPVCHGALDDGATMLLLNHQSYLDVILMDALHPKPIVWIAKQELAHLPLFGRLMTQSDTILIDRDDRRGLLRLLKEARQARELGKILAIFPEGTRSDGSTLLPFKPGARALAEKLDLHVQPIVIRDTRKVLNTKTFSSDLSRPVSLYPLAAFTPDRNESWLENLRTHMQQVLTP